MLQEISTQTVKVRAAAIFALLLSLSFSTANAHDEKQASKTVPHLKSTSKSTATKSSTTTSAPPKSPPSAVLTAEQRGEKVFKKAYCAGCHSNGNNAMMPDKPIKGKAFEEKYKDDAALERTIRKGFPDEGMPPSGKDQISEAQMKDLILYIRSFTPNK